MSDRGRRGISRKNAGLLLALAFSLIAAGVVLFFVVRSRGDRDGAIGPASAGLGSTEVPPVPPAGGGAGANPSPFGSIGGSGWARLQFVDREDPSRVASEMEWLSLEPLEQRGRSLITEPRFWIYPEGGMTIHIQAKQARVFQPNQQSEPESGRLDQGVVIRGFAAGEDGDRRTIDLEKDVPLFLIVTDSLNFDTPIGEISTIDPWEISTAEVEASGVGLRLQLNELRERLELLEVERGGSIRYSRAAAPEKERSADEGPAVAGGEGGEVAAAGPVTPKAVREDLYRAVFSGEVRVQQRQRVLVADTLEVWTRLLDGAFPENAVPRGEARGAGSVDRVAGGAVTLFSSPAAAVAAAAVGVVQPDGETQPGTVATITPAPAQDEDDIVLTWTGPLVLRPTEPTPTELQEGNHLALRFTADRTGFVTFADQSVGISGRCTWIGYRATKQDLTMAGPGPAAVTVKTDDGKQVQVGRLELNLGTGIGLIPGGGVLSDRGREITWTDQSDLQFATENGAMTGALRESAFTGRVLAKNPDGSSVSGDFLRAIFTATQEQATALARLIVDGNAVGDTGNSGGSLRADKLDLLFQPAPGGGKNADPEPRVLTAVGSVRAERGPTRLTAEFLEATLVTDSRGDVGAEDVRALGEVRFKGENDLAAGAEEVFVNVPRQAARLTGQGSYVGRGTDRVNGSEIELDGLARTLLVSSGGKFVHTGERAVGGNPRSRPMTATWTRSMSFDDRSGVVECHGGVVASTDPNAPTVDLAKGEHLRIEFTPGPAAGDGSIAGATTTTPPAPIAEDRKLLRAQISGDGDSEALVESRVYIADATQSDGRRLARFTRLMGGRIIADDTAGTLSVPGAGRAAIYDGRSTSDTGEAVAAEPGDLLQGQSFRGSALFVWTGSMDMERSKGLLKLRRAVQMVHRPLDGGPPATMECERLDATFNIPSGATAAASAGMELKEAHARDAVYVESGGRQLLADAVAYDAAAATAEATAAEGNRVTLYDETRAAPVTARTLLWNLATDRIFVREPTPIVAPVVEPRR